MTPVFKIEANGADVTSALQKNLSSIAFSDEDGNQSDEITIKVVGDFKRPKYEDQIKLWLGYEESALFFCGLFLVQTTERDSFGLTITATGADFSKTLKQKRDTSYEQLSIKAIAAMIAKRNSLSLKCDFDDMQITHLSQTNEADLQFMKRLATEYNAIFSVKNNTLVFMKRTKESKKSDALAVFDIDASECSNITVKHANKTLYNSCVARWHDTKTNETKSITVGSGDPVLRMEGQFKTPADAKAKAEAKLESANRGTKTGTITMYGREIYAGGVLKLSGAGEDNGEYSIKSVNHAFGGGWSMSIEIES